MAAALASPLACAVPVGAQGHADLVPIRPLDLSFYHRTDTLLESLARMSQPSECAQRMFVDNLHDGDDPSFRLPFVTFVDDYTHRQPRARADHKRVLLNFGAHGQEMITSEVALRLARMLCGEAPSRFYGSEERSRQRIGELLQQVVIRMVPVQVPSSRALAESASSTCRNRRLNARGVDVNRNWDVSWSAGDPDVRSGTYRGDRPFSEAETRTLAELARSWSPDVFVDVHSGDRFVAMPYASRLGSPSNATQRNAMRRTMEAVASMIGKQHPQLLGMGGTLPYGPAASLGEEPARATGTALDYMYSTLKVPRCFMFEVFGTSHFFPSAGAFRSKIAQPPRGVLASLGANEAPPAAGSHEVNASRPRGDDAYDCISYFNPTSAVEYERTVNAWADALLVVVNQSTIEL